MGFSVEPKTVNSLDIWATGGFGGLNTQAAPVTVTFTNGVGTSTFKINTAPTKISANDIQWDWKMKIDSKVYNIEATKHEIYISNAASTIPIAGLPKIFKTMAKWSCKGAENATTNALIIQGCYNHLGSLKGYSYVFPWDKPFGPHTQGYNVFLDNKKGKCGHWGFMLWGLIEYQGVDVWYVDIIPDTTKPGWKAPHPAPGVFVIMQTNLSANINATATTIPVGTTTGADSTGYFIIESELIKFTGKTANSFTGCTRGVGETDAVPHNQGKQVTHFYTESRCYHITAAAMGGNTGPWIFGDHAFVMTGDATGKVYDPTYYQSNATGYGAYEDQLIQKFTISPYRNGTSHAGTGNKIWSNPSGNDSKKSVSYH